jgi:predicted DCC family thiol-disulfide oxidoreductase YuxK
VLRPGVISTSNRIILYDGVCGLCNRLNQFVLKRDRNDRFRFAALQSEFAGKVLERHGVSPQVLDTMYLLLNYSQPDERLVSRSDAAVQILEQLGGAWSALASIVRVLPRWFRDKAYNFIARNRYQLFGKYQTCQIPDERYRSKFL